MTPQETLKTYMEAYKEARDFREEYTRHSMKPLVGPKEVLSFWKSLLKPSPSVGYADPVPFGTKLKAFFSRNPAAVINGTPVQPSRTYAKR